MSTPDLFALVYRLGKGCRQYPFYSVGGLEVWAKRHPYRGETVRVMVVRDSKFVADKVMPAMLAAEFVRENRGAVL